MRRYSNSKHLRINSELNVTPLLDLCFTLLIIFMITTPLMESSIEVRLPRAGTGATTSVDPEKVSTITVNRSGEVFLNEVPVPAAELTGRLAAMVEAVPDMVVRLRADRELIYERLVGVLEAVKQAGVRMDLATEPRP